ncbi:hypothetical protein KR222_000073, partial [Zaprionus bogoriensis]
IMLTFLLALLAIVAPIKIGRAREAVRPQQELGQILKELEEVQLNETMRHGATCTLDIQKELPRSNKPQPLYLHPNTDTYWLPNAKGQLEIPHNAIIELHCGDSSFAKLAPEDHMSPRTSSIHARCLYGRTFSWEHGEKRELGDFYCRQPPSYVVERTKQPCGDGDLSSAARLYRVGHRIHAARFVLTLELCHDAEQLRTHYSFYQFLPANAHFQQDVKRIQFSTAGHFNGYNMARLYTQAHQRQRVGQLLQQAATPAALAGDELADFVDSLFDEKGGMFLSRGHLAAKSDLIYANQQRCSFNYLNVAPQWQSFNGGHWAVVEDATRRFVARSGLSVSVYTGTYGVMSLPDTAETDFHLATDANNNAVLPVPSLYYRLLIDNERPWRGLALIGVNNPFATLDQIRQTYVICEPLDPQLLTWLRWLENANLKKGYLYACTVADLARVVRHLPPQLQEVHEPLV